jgi:hypothetical protein
MTVLVDAGVDVDVDVDVDVLASLSEYLVLYLLVRCKKTSCAFLFALLRVRFALVGAFNWFETWRRLCLTIKGFSNKEFMLHLEICCRLYIK